MVDDQIKVIYQKIGLNYKKFLKYHEKDDRLYEFRKQLTSEYIKGVQK